MFDLKLQKVNLKDIEEVQRVKEFLADFDLNLDTDVDYTIVLLQGESIKATCSKARNVLKCFAVHKDMRGEGVTSTLISHLIDRLFEEEIYHSFIFTKPENIHIFSTLNYKLVHEVKAAALLENGIYDINSYLNKLVKNYNIDDSKKAAIVMNCNPFTLGHLYLIEKAASENEEVIIFMVEEDRSLFPFKVRYDLVKEGTKHLRNVKVIPGGEYIISSATFPSYFLREESTRLQAYTELDTGIFAKYFCKRLNITKRYVGTEPYCGVTNSYNEAIQKVLTENEIEVRLVERITYNGKEISASLVRQLIREGNLQELQKIVPKATFEFLYSDSAKEIIEKIKNSNSPH